jgi:hypothetical protein
MEKNLSLQLFLMEDDSKILNKKREKMESDSTFFQFFSFNQEQSH